MAGLIALYDACILYPAPLRDLFIHLAMTGLFQAKWTEGIHDEWTRSVLRDRPDLTGEQLARTRQLMNAHGGDCLVEGYQDLISTLSLPDPDDRHVLAAAVVGRADIIVTFNLSDFPPAALSSYGIEAQHPDDFVVHLLEMDQAVILGAVRRQRANLRKPPVEAEQFLERLESQGLPQTAAWLRRFADFL